MPLSENERRILQEIERQFYEQDPEFARGVAAGTVATKFRRNFRWGIALFALGFAVLVAFFLRPEVPVGVLAFLMMLAGATLAHHSARKITVEQVRESGAASLSKVFGKVEGRLRKLRRRKSS
jgi:membrane-bound ClpP family serine protease